MNKRIIDIMGLGLAFALSGYGNIYPDRSESRIQKGYYNPEKKREFDKKGNPIKRTTKGKRKSKKVKDNESNR